MTIWWLLSFAFRVFGLWQWADAAFAKHEAKVKVREISDAQAAINRTDDADVGRVLRDEYTRD
jgi:hypothetical protein